MPRGDSKTTLNQPQGKQEIVGGTGVEAPKRLESTSAQFKACKNNTVGYSV